MENLGQPSWSAEALPNAMALVTVTYPNDLPGGVGRRQTLQLPMADVAVVFSGLDDFVTWNPIKVLQAYVVEADRLIALEEFEPNRDTWTFAQVLPSIPENYQCLACAQAFQQHPGAAVQCPRCGYLYAQVE
jgi:hypothetical protein